MYIITIAIINKLSKHSIIERGRSEKPLDCHWTLVQCACTVHHCALYNGPHPQIGVLEVGLLRQHSIKIFSNDNQ